MTVMKRDFDNSRNFSEWLSFSSLLSLQYLLHQLWFLIFSVYNCHHFLLIFVPVYLNLRQNLNDVSAVTTLSRWRNYTQFCSTLFCFLLFCNNGVKPEWRANLDLNLRVVGIFFCIQNISENLLSTPAYHRMKKEKAKLLIVSI